MLEIILKGASLHWPYLARMDFVMAIAGGLQPLLHQALDGSQSSSTYPSHQSVTFLLQNMVSCSALLTCRHLSVFDSHANMTVVYMEGLQWQGKILHA